MTRPDVAPLKEAGGIPGNPDEMGDPDPDPIHKSGNSKAQRKLLPGETLGWAEGGGGWRRVAEGREIHQSAKMRVRIGTDRQRWCQIGKTAIAAIFDVANVTKVMTPPLIDNRFQFNGIPWIGWNGI